MEPGRLIRLLWLIARVGSRTGRCFLAFWPLTNVPIQVLRLRLGAVALRCVLSVWKIRNGSISVVNSNTNAKFNHVNLTQYAALAT